MLSLKGWYECSTGKVQQEVERESDEWLLGVDRALAGQMGYGSIYDDGSHHYAHRISYEVFIGPIPDGMNVLHDCDNPPCCNPGHLFLGTQAVNIADRDAKGRQRSLKGSKSPNAKLTESDIPKIRSRLARGFSKAEVAEEFRVSRAAIWKIDVGQNWAQV